MTASDDFSERSPQNEQTPKEELSAALPDRADPSWRFLFADGVAFCAADVRLIRHYYCDPSTGAYFMTDMYGRRPVQITAEELHDAEQRKERFNEEMGNR